MCVRRNVRFFRSVGVGVGDGIVINAAATTAECRWSLLLDIDFRPRTTHHVPCVCVSEKNIYTKYWSKLPETHSKNIGNFDHLIDQISMNMKFYSRI